MQKTLFSVSDLTITTEFEKYLTDFQTPPDICRYMVSLLPAAVNTVLEPTPGNGNIVNALKGYTVTAPADFFLLNKKRFDAVVMNPPFSSRYTNIKNAPVGFGATGIQVGYYMLTECLKLSDTVIALMPWFTVTDSVHRVRTFKNFGMKSLTHLPRSSFGNTRIQTVIMEMNKGYTGETAFKVYDLL